MVDAGETSGTLEVVLLRLADFTESQLALRNKIKGAMTYPFVMLGFGAIMIGLIFTVVIPKITKVFISQRRALPLQTRICVWFFELSPGLLVGSYHWRLHCCECFFPLHQNRKRSRTMG
jgi:type II secretory pathway component PulF